MDYNKLKYLLLNYLFWNTMKTVQGSAARLPFQSQFVNAYTESPPANIPCIIVFTTFGNVIAKRCTGDRSNNYPLIFLADDSGQTLSYTTTADPGHSNALSADRYDRKPQAI